MDVWRYGGMALTPSLVCEGWEGGWFWKSGCIEVWRYRGIVFVVLERSSGTQLVFFKKLDFQPSAEDDVGKAEDDGKKLKMTKMDYHSALDH